MFQIFVLYWESAYQPEHLKPVIMINVANILARKDRRLVSVKPDTPVLEALRIMAEENIGSVLVMEHNTYKGLLTERDYARKVILRGKLQPIRRYPKSCQPICPGYLRKIPSSIAWNSCRPTISGIFLYFSIMNWWASFPSTM